MRKVSNHRSKFQANSDLSLRHQRRPAAPGPNFEILGPRLMLDAAGMLESQLILPRLIESTLASIKVEYDIPSPSLLEAATGADGQTLKTIALADAPSLGVPGRPVLPVIPAQIILPAGYELADFHVTPGARHVLPGSHLLQAGAAPVALGEETGTPPAPASIYSSAGPFPGSLFDVIGVQNRRGVSILCVNLNPVVYVPASGQVSYYDNLTLHVSTRPAPAGQEGLPYRPDPVSSLAAGVANPGMLATYQESQPAGVSTMGGGLESGGMDSGSGWITTLDESGCGPSYTFDYVLITSQAIADATTDYNVGDLMQIRQDLGLSPTIVTAENILGLSCYEGVDDAESIRNFITDAYSNWGTNYVLLGGDTGIIPARELWSQMLDLVYENGEMVEVIREAMIPSDLYYQCLDGDFNHNGNYFYGEPEDGPDGREVDLLAEVCIGRASVGGSAAVTEMSNFVYKTIRYERPDLLSQPGPDTDTYYQTALIASQYLGTGFGPGEFAWGWPRMEEIRAGADTLGYTTAGFDGSGFSTDTHYERYWDDPLKTWQEEMIDLLESDAYSVINHVGHGNDSKGLGLYNNEIDGLENTKPFFAYLGDCTSGKFTADCWAEHATTSTRNGAFAVVANSHWGQDCPATSFDEIDGGSQRINRQFWDAYFGEGIITLGEMNADSHHDNIWGVTDHAVRHNYFTTNLFGDPATPIFAGCHGDGVQEPFAVDDATVTTEDVPVVIDVLDNDSAPLGETLAVFSVTDGVYGTVAINPGGLSVTYTPAPDFEGTDIFTYSAITESGYPAAATVTVTVQDDPYDLVAFDPTVRLIRRGPVVWEALSVNSYEPHRTAILTIQVQFSEDVSASLNANYETALSLFAFAHSGEGLVDITGVGFDYDAATETATWIFHDGDDYLVELPDAAYEAALVSSLITDATSNPLDGDRDGSGGDDYTFEFHKLEADINGDALVDLCDFGILKANFGKSPASPNEGDINLDDLVDIQDFGILKARFGHNVFRTDPPTSVALITDTGVPGDNITKLNNGDPASALQFEVTGTLSGATVTVYADGQAIGSATASGGTTIVTTDGDYELADGAHLITARQKQPAYLRSKATEPLEIVVDATPPSVASNPEVNDGALQRHSINTMEFTFSEDVVASGAALGIYYYDEGWQLETASTPEFSSTSNTATWSWDFEELLPDYEGHLVAKLASAEITDIAGNELDGDGDGIAGDDYLFNDDGDNPAEEFHRLDCDMDGNAIRDGADIDYLWDRIAGSYDYNYDLDEDSNLDADDVTMLVEDLGFFWTYFGDANLDGSVDSQDSAIVSAHMEQPGGWEEGDFNGDDFVDEDDLAILNDNMDNANDVFDRHLELGSVPSWP